jgi:hypothetical protein
MEKRMEKAAFMNGFGVGGHARAAWIRIALGVVMAVSACGAGAATTDQSGCLLCHKYPGFGRYDKEADGRLTKRVLYLNEELHRASYHGRFGCSKCHEGVDRIPHTGAKPVDCGVSCHIMDPSSGHGFSHRDIVEDLKKSAHGRDGARSKERADLPACRDCHTNKPYQIGVQQHTQSMAFAQVCRQCHENQAWVERFYRHVSYRATMRRPSKEVVKLCGRCHADSEMMAKHELEVVIGFRDTFHGKAIQYGNEDVANCLSCHAPYALGSSPHRIASRRDGHSPVNAKNKLATCSQCHIGASEAFAARGKAHPAEATLASLTRTVERAGDEFQREEAIQSGVVKWVRLIYQIAIALVVGGLAAHRILDLYARRRDRKREEH